ncbi:Hypothetical predicted protein [Octopus vulgaris]|uniref:Uncharacterized protein n=1 Tax=Octopus vulgaris TaxID=6645 RepID=A0AA36F1U7_OCTVU|nr:Hypothetical predicted protein [Octopus vulgaris]
MQNRFFESSNLERKNETNTNKNHMRIHTKETECTLADSEYENILSCFRKENVLGVSKLSDIDLNNNKSQRYERLSVSCFQRATLSPSNHDLLKIVIKSPTNFTLTFQN